MLLTRRKKFLFASNNMWTIIVISTIFQVIHSASRQGSVQEYFMNSKFNCTGKRIFPAASELQCIHRCLSNDKCEITNYKGREDGDVKQHNCEVYDVLSYHESCSLKAAIGWKGLILKRKTEPKPKVYKSCKEINQNLPGAISGVYELKDGKHFCRMGDILECGSGGWTLAMKINGTKDTFNSDKEIWGNNVTYNEDNGIKSFYAEEAKFNAFSKLSFDLVCIGMKHEGTTKWLLLNQTGSSLQDIFKTGTYVATSISRDAWKSLIYDSSLQVHCNRQGFNVKDYHGRIYARIGYLGNQENECITPDSFIALGSTNNVACSSSLPKISCGNFASCSPDNGDKSLAAMGFILVQ